MTKWHLPFLILLAISTAQSGVKAATFIPLGSLDSSDSMATGLSGDGSVVVGWSESSQGRQAFTWSANSGMQGLGDLPGGAFESYALGVSGNGSTILGRGYSPGNIEPIIWQAGSIQSLSSSPAGTFESTGAYASSFDGSVIVGSSLIDGNYQAFRWTAATGLTALAGTGTVKATSTSADGSVIVGDGLTDGVCCQAFVWTAKTGAVGLGDFNSDPFTSSTGTAVSADGSVVVGYASGLQNGENAFLWTALEGMQPLSLASGYQASRAFGVSGDGSIVVGSAHDGHTSDAVFWDAAGPMQNLLGYLIENGASNLAGWALKETLAVSADGTTVAGWGVNPSGAAEAFVATLSPVPIPASLWLYGGALAALACIRRQLATL